MWNNISKSSADHNNSLKQWWTFTADVQGHVHKNAKRNHSTKLNLPFPLLILLFISHNIGMLLRNANKRSPFPSLPSSRLIQAMTVGRTFTSMWAMICVLMSLPLKWILMIFMYTVWILLFSLLILKKDMRSSGVGSSLDVWLSISSEWLEWWVLRMLELLHNKECG